MPTGCIHVANTCTIHTTIRALETLNVSANNLTRGVALKKDNRSARQKQRDERWGSKDSHYETNLDGIIALADGIKNSGALTSLDLASNRLGAEGAKHVAEAIKVHVSLRRFD